MKKIALLLSKTPAKINLTSVMVYEFSLEPKIDGKQYMLIVESQPQVSPIEMFRTHHYWDYLFNNKNKKPNWRKERSFTHQDGTAYDCLSHRNYTIVTSSKDYLELKAGK